MDQFRPGDVVDITIKGARFKEYGAHSWFTVTVSGSVDLKIFPQPSITVERVAPAEWPPRAGDLWRSERQPYFAVDFGNSDVVMINLGGERLSPDFVLCHSPMTLVSRIKAAA